MSDSVRPQRWQSTRLPRPWDSPGKDTGVGCHFLLQCMNVKSESEVAQLCPTLSDPMDFGLPGSSIHGICQARVLEWVAIAFSDIYNSGTLNNEPPRYPNLVIVILYGKDFPNVVKLRILRWGDPLGFSRLALDTITSVLIE